MNISLNYVDDMIVNIEDKVNELGKGDKNAFIEMTKESGMLSKFYTCVLSDLDELKKGGTDIPADILVSQLKNYLEAVKYNDIIMMYDVLKYEVLEVLRICKEVLLEYNT